MYKYQIVKDSGYFRDVLGNLESHDEKSATVRFGEMGKGVHPNYQITDGNKLSYCYKGKSHKPYSDDDLVEFNDDNLSPPLTYESVKEEIGRCKTL